MLGKEKQNITFNVISSEQEASSCPCGSHLMAFTSFWKVKETFVQENLQQNFNTSSNIRAYKI